MDKNQIFDIVVQHAKEVIPALEGHPFRPTDALRDLGANSVDRSDITVMTLESLSLRVPLVELARVANIGELVDILHAKLQ
ncbi:acyl carrier protein [Roseateles flavus]|uniref:Acyl carrier protein n=1 Tax=Roseateles flavus TaxID=3149041 RepID=A0ABV0GBH7_9BURK